MTGPLPIARLNATTLRGEASAATAKAWRKAVHTWLEETVDIGAELIADIVLAVNEALANCADHAYPHSGQRGTMTLELHYDQVENAVEIYVTDQGRWIDPERVAFDPTRGRGLALMHTLADVCTVNGRSNGTTVCLHFHYCPPRNQADQTRTG